MKKKIVACILALGLCFGMTTTAFATEGTGEDIQTAEDRLATDKESYAFGEPVMVTAVGTGTDWLGIAKGDSEGSNFWWYVENLGSGTPIDLVSVLKNEGKMLPPGTYTLRVIANDGGWTSENVLDEVKFTVVPAEEKTDGLASLEDSLVAYYDGIDNAEGGHNAETTVWKDLSGKGNDFTIDTDSFAWSDKALQVQSDRVGYFPQSIVDVTNSGTYTFEIAFGAFESLAYEYDTLVYSTNDEFSIFRRAAADVLEFKYCDANGDANRAKANDGVNALTDSTVTYVVNSETATVKMYVDGVLVSEGGLYVVGNTADDLALGHKHGDRKWNGDVYSIRFYDRALTEDEVKQNVAEIDAKYRTVATPEPTQEPTKEPTNDPTKEPAKENNTVVIVIAVIAVVAIVGGAVYVISKKKNK